MNREDAYAGQRCKVLVAKRLFHLPVTNQFRRAGMDLMIDKSGDMDHAVKPFLGRFHEEE